MFIQLNDKISHAYLFSGPRGTGKTSTAKIIARMINCNKLGIDGLPCGECDKFGEICHMTAKDIEAFKHIQSEEECEHNWVLDKTNIGLVNTTNHYVCSKCGKTKIESLGMGI